MLLIVGGWRDRAPSGCDGLLLDVALLTTRFRRAIVDLEEAF